MTTYKSEEEQIAALKNWWKENGNSLLIGIGAALLIVFGWKAYQNSVIEQKAEASMLYQELISAATENSFSDAEEGSTVTYLANELKGKFEETEYALYATMFLAKEASAEGNYDEALAQLNWAKERTEDIRLQHILAGRLARIMSAQGKHDEALNLLTATDPQFEASFLEIKGDILKRQGKNDAAIEAYTKAFVMVKEAPQSLPLLAVKLSDLGVNPETL